MARMANNPVIRAPALALLLLAGCDQSVDEIKIPQSIYQDLMESDWNCTFDTRSICLDDGCKSTNAEAATLNILPKRGLLQRCDIDGGDCIDVESNFTHSGLYLSGTAQNTGAFVKLGEDGRVVEAVSLMTTVQISYGQCHPMAGL